MPSAFIALILPVPGRTRPSIGFGHGAVAKLLFQARWADGMSPWA